MKENKPHVANNSGNNEWYTPTVFIEAARNTMLSIDTDPASSDIAQVNVKAKVYFTKESNGLDKDWNGNVWMNPPYSSSLISKFIDKLKLEHAKGNTKQSIVLVNNATETKWAKELMENCNAVCFIHKRVKFLDQAGLPKNTPLQGQMLVYRGSNTDRFKDCFNNLGIILSNNLV